jgi:hypothetical protein
LLTHLRYMGYVFNPVSFYYVWDKEVREGGFGGRGKGREGGKEGGKGSKGEDAGGVLAHVCAESMPFIETLPPSLLPSLPPALGRARAWKPWWPR